MDPAKPQCEACTYLPLRLQPTEPVEILELSDGTSLTGFYAG